MVKPVQKAEISSFIKGLITDASPLNFPGDASLAEENFELNLNGSRQRRLGIDFEIAYDKISTNYTAADLINKASSSYRWFNAGRNANNDFLVVQIGGFIHVFDIDSESISSQGYIGSLEIAGADPTRRFSYASVEGNLIVASGTEEIIFVSYNDNTNTLSTSTKRILVRDLWGLPSNDNNDLNLRPATANSEYSYNLRNQGWGVPRKDSAGNLSDPINLFYNAFSRFPSNADVVLTGLSFQANTSGDPFERFYPSMMDDALGLTNTRSALGYYIIDALRRGTSRKAAEDANVVKFPSLTARVASLPADRTPGGATVVTDFSGRVFYGGFSGEVIEGDANSPILSSYIFFSQVSKKQDDLVKCYQAGDPTSREDSDLVDTDGGFIRISGAKTINGLIGLEGSLFVLADNGVWSVQGGSDYGFTATNYFVKKVSNFGCINPNTIVVANSQIFFWNEAGIFMIAKDQFGDFQVVNIVEGLIQEFYDDITPLQKTNAYGIYDPYSKKIRWVYGISLNVNDMSEVLELTFDTRLKSFSPVRFYNLPNAETPRIIGLISSSSFDTGDQVDEVVVQGEGVVVDSEIVTVTVTERDSAIQATKYIALTGVNLATNRVGFSFAQYSDTTFRDWKSIDGVGADAKGFLLTGTTTLGDSAVAKQSPYLVMHFRRTEREVVRESGELIPDRPSGCLVQAQWDWATSALSNKWGTKFQAYRVRRPQYITGASDEFDNGFDVTTSKNKLRGRGKAISILMETEPDKDCQILGWSLALTGNNF